MSGWTQDEIFFDDEDMSTEEQAWNIMLWYGEAFNPISFVTDPMGKLTPRGVVQTGVAGGIVGTAAWIVGGPLSTMAGQGPNFGRMMALKAHSYAEIGRYGSHIGSLAWRGAAFTVRNAGFIGVILSLPWLFENVVEAGMEEVIDFMWPDLDQLKFGQDQ